MNRRAFLLALSAAVPTIGPNRAEAQDTEFLRALDAAQTSRPALVPTVARIAPEGEPGIPLVIHGRLYEVHDRPLPDAVVFAYHTDSEGLYDRRDRPAHSWRLRGWARTDSEGRYEFRTIRPAPYPSRQIPAHVHVNVYASGRRFSAGELRFADDNLVPRHEREASNRRGEFGWIRSVTVREGVQHVDYSVRLDAARVF